VRFTPDGKFGCSGDEDGEIHVWDVATGATRTRMLGHQHGVFVLGVSRDGTRLASGGWDNTVRVWKLDDGQELLTLRGHASGIYASEFSPDGETLFTVSGEGLVRVWASGVKRRPSPAPTPTLAPQSP
jgi:WD40 repeat protein